MTESEKFIFEKIKQLVPNCDKVEFKASVNRSSYSVEFFALVDGKRLQCFEMIDVGLFTEKEFKDVSKAVAEHLRSRSDFKTDGVNKYEFLLEQE